MDDLELLWEYGRSGGSMPCARVAERYADLIYSAALRQVAQPACRRGCHAGGPDHPDEQGRDASAGNRGGRLAGQGDPLCSVDALKMEARRKNHERKAAAMRNATSGDDQAVQWEEFRAAGCRAAEAASRGRDACAAVSSGNTRRSLGAGRHGRSGRKRVSRARAIAQGVSARQGVQAGNAAWPTVLTANAVQPCRRRSSLWPRVSAAALPPLGPLALIAACVRALVDRQGKMDHRHMDHISGHCGLDPRCAAAAAWHSLSRPGRQMEPPARRAASLHRAVPACIGRATCSVVSRSMTPRTFILRATSIFRRRKPD